MTDFDFSLVDQTRNAARLQNDVMFAVRRGARRAEQVVIRAADFRPHPALTIIYVAYPPSWRYADRLAWRLGTRPGRSHTLPENQLPITTRRAI